MLRFLLLALLALSPARAAPPGMPDALALDRLRARLLDPGPPGDSGGAIGFRPVDGMAGVGATFRRLDPPLPGGWRGQAIVVESGTHHIEALAGRMPGPGWLDCVEKLCALKAPLVVRPGAALVIEGTDLKLGQREGAAILSWGRLIVSDARLRAWDMVRDGPAETDDEGRAFRPFVAGYAASHTLIRRSDIRHLGHQAAMSYGLSFGTDNRSRTPTEFPSVDMIGNRLMDVYFGFFSYDADGVNLIDNHISESHVYGIDPHDDTRNMLIHGNYVYGARRSHGIILSRRIHRTVVSHNTSAGNAKAGFFMDKASRDVRFIGNDSFMNKGEGLVLHEVASVDVIGNRFHGNGGDGIRLRASEAVFLDGNLVTGNARHGIRAYDWRGAKRAPNAEEQGQIVPMRLGLIGNRIHGNRRGDCRLTGDARVTAGQPFTCPGSPGAVVPARFGPAAGNAP